MSETSLEESEKLAISEIYYGLHKESLASVIRNYAADNSLLQITTFSLLLTEGARLRLCDDLNMAKADIHMITLQQINTEEQFAKRVGLFFAKRPEDDAAGGGGGQRILIVQGQITPETPASLVECVRYSILNQIQQHQLAAAAPQFCVALVLKVPRCHGGLFAGFPGTQWAAFHIDELGGDQHGLNIEGWTNRSLHQVLEGEDVPLLRKIVAEATPRAVAMAFKEDKQAAGRIPSAIQILTECLAAHDHQVRVPQ